jgi:hypothetical protein
LSQSCQSDKGAGSTKKTCNSWTYSDWSNCINGIQTRKITKAFPDLCSGGTPLLTLSCKRKDLTTGQISSPANNPKSYINIDNTKVNQLSLGEADLIHAHRTFVKLTPPEITLYDKTIALQNKKLTQNQSRAIAQFIHAGTDSTTRLGAGERAGILSSYLVAFNGLPAASSSEWQDLIKISNGRWPEKRNLPLEEKLQKTLFKTIYKREFNKDNSNDKSALMIMTYGLLPINRNIATEKKAIKIYSDIFKHPPKTASDWNIIRVISYSGAKR